MGKQFHLVSDLDGTWLPQNESSDDLHKLEAFLDANPEVTFTVATGRTLESAITVMERTLRRMPEHLITDVGGALYHRIQANRWAEDLDYSARLDDVWDHESAQSFSLLWLPPGVRAQVGVDARHRIPLQMNQCASARDVLDLLKAELREIGLEAYPLLSSQTCIDILPKGTDKGSAAAYLHHALAARQPMIACGDSENDLGLFRVADWGILMADSHLGFGNSGLPRDKIMRTVTPGPMGILDSILKLVHEGKTRLLGEEKKPSWVRRWFGHRNGGR